MARALRIQCPGGRYHVTARGNERREIFWDDTDRFHFLELLSELGKRFGTRVHAYVLMVNHSHLLLETPEPNLGRAMHGCNVSYSVWFNLRHRRSGHLLQARSRPTLCRTMPNHLPWLPKPHYWHVLCYLSYLIECAH